MSSSFRRGGYKVSLTLQLFIAYSCDHPKLANVLQGNGASSTFPENNNKRKRPLDLTLEAYEENLDNMVGTIDK